MGFDVWLENRTPFDAATHVQLDADGQEVVLVMVSASFETKGQELEIAKSQLPVCFADEPFGDPVRSSNRYEADIALSKPKVDVIVVGRAYAPDGKPAEHVDAGLAVGNLRKILRVTGDRLETMGGVSRPKPFLTMPLIWERAFGGTDDDGNIDLRNPVGIGWKGAKSADPEGRSDLPNIAYAGDDGPDPEPAGFGFVGRGWQPRLSLAGTYDEAWLADQWPLAPHDFNALHNLGAPPDQQFEKLPERSKVSLVNMTPDGRWNFSLPGLRLPAHLIYADRVETVTPMPDTVILEPELKRVTLKARIAVTLVRNTPRLRGIALGHVSPVWLNARRKGKAYFNPRGGDGTLDDVPVWAP
ncbi:DUF2169 domain-containing protein (plasmid) [Sulfitobacter sp. S223]|uniref:DUF2169 family type VI secretion system accessory protein n=1 Tax=Sulfitobacter sp. S223 TaxID=2867023 RepID=UPI0021A3738A|nr:DUF2169 domain-containing protein [Sulfitobacter sp. S223]UWR28257.1 DUF2169 domain-containing protein [Sulfitobacter sp. S223]